MLKLNKDSIEFYWDDLTKEAQKDFFEFLGGENGNYDVFPFAVIINNEKEEEEFVQSFKEDAV